MKIQRTLIPKARIEMIPLIDSVFLILVYFIFAFLSMSVHRGIPLSLPVASTSVQEKVEHYGISITEKGQYYWNQELVSLEELRSKLTDAAQQNERIFVYGDQNARHGQVVEVLNLLRELKINKVFVETNVKGSAS